MLLKNINYLLQKRQAPELGALQFAALDPEKLWALIETLGVSFERLNTVDLSAEADIAPQTIKLLLLDVDGVFTDGGMYYTAAGEEMKRFFVRDGLGIQLAMKAGLEIGIISAALKSGVTAYRAEMLGIKRLYIGLRPKIDVLHEWLVELKIPLSAVAYIGDDVNDLAVLSEVGISACPVDAHPKVLRQVQIVLQNKGGQGCIREFIDRFILPEA